MCCRLCFPVPLSSGDRLFDAGVKDLLSKKVGGEFGPSRFSTFVGQ